MCQLCDEFKTIEFELAHLPASFRLDEDNPHYLLLRIEELKEVGGNLTKPFKINYCFICGKKLN